MDGNPGFKPKHLPELAMDLMFCNGLGMAQVRSASWLPVSERWMEADLTAFREG
jgi:hypothetical protein